MLQKRSITHCFLWETIVTWKIYENVLTNTNSA